MRLPLPFALLALAACGQEMPTGATTSRASGNVCVALLQELIEIDQDLRAIVRNRPTEAVGEAVGRWMDAVEVEARKVSASLERHGVFVYDAAIGSEYHPALHERVGSRAVVGMESGRVAEQVKAGYASRQPEFVLIRPQVILSE